MAIEEGTTFFYCQLVRKMTMPALETIMHDCVKPGAHAKTDEYKSYFWLDKITNARTHQPSRPSLHTHPTVFHKKKHSRMRTALMLTELRVKTMSSKARIHL